jgi:pyruvate kinase
LTGIYKSDKGEYNIGDEVTITTDPKLREHQSKDLIWISYSNLNKAVKTGQSILLDDGALEAVVMKVNDDGVTLQAVMKNAGVLGNRKGVNIPGAVLDGLPAMSNKDREDIEWGIKNDIDCIAASFIRRANDVEEIRTYCAELIALHRVPGSPLPLIISKIESTEALENIDEIVEASDGLMVARGDLGVEIPVEDLTMVQKDLVARCNQAGKPVIVATQMLESMQKSPRPTRAECTDVANAVFDGADCVMLSGESAKGKYPVEAVTTMNRIVQRSESFERVHNILKNKIDPPAIPTKMDAIATAVTEASHSLEARAILDISNSGNTAIRIASHKPHVPIVTFVPSHKLGRMLQLYRGIHPVISSMDLLGLQEGRLSKAAQECKKLGFADKGDNVLVVAADGSEEGVGTRVTMSVVTLE